MIRAALTGGIATGKSYCLSVFATLGVPTVDADRLAREVVEPGSPGLAAVALRFGPGILTPAGALDRPALGRIVFSDRSARADLEAIVHPLVYHRISEWFADRPAGTRVAIADIPLLFETGQQHQFERVIVCACDPAEQLRRVMKRDGLTVDEARARLEAQWPVAEKVARAHHVIYTDGTHADTDAQVRRVYELLTAGR